MLGDGGYVGEPTKITTKSCEHPKEIRKWIREALAWQETLHGWLKGSTYSATAFGTWGWCKEQDGPPQDGS